MVKKLQNKYAEENFVESKFNWKKNYFSEFFKTGSEKLSDFHQKFWQAG